MSDADKMRVVSIAGATGGGTQDLTVAGFGTPTAAIVFLTRATKDATVDSYGASIGFTDGTNEMVVGARTRHGTTNEEADRIWSNGGHLGYMMSTGGDPLAGDAPYFSMNGWITDGVQITWNSAPGTAIHIVAVLIQCANAQVGKFDTSATQDVATTITMSPAFAPETVFIIGNDSGAASGASAPYCNQAFGFADYNGSTVEQVSIVHAISDDAATGDPDFKIFNDRVRGHPLNAETIELENFTSSAFDATTRDAASASLNMGYLALGWNTADRKVAAFDSPTHGSTPVDKSFTWPGFNPQCVILGLTTATVYTTQENDADAGPYGIGVFDEEGGEECVAYADEDAATTINSESTHASNAIELHDDAGSALFDANFANGSIDTTGYTLEFTAIPSATVRKWIGFALAPGAHHAENEESIATSNLSALEVQVSVEDSGA